MQSQGLSRLYLTYTSCIA